MRDVAACRRRLRAAVLLQPCAGDLTLPPMRELEVPPQHLDHGRPAPEGALLLHHVRRAQHLRAVYRAGMPLHMFSIRPPARRPKMCRARRVGRTAPRAARARPQARQRRDERGGAGAARRERARGRGEDPAADDRPPITGAKPFGGAYWLAVQMAVLESDPVPPRRVRPDCPQALETIVLRCSRRIPRGATRPRASSPTISRGCSPRRRSKRSRRRGPRDPQACPPPPRGLDLGRRRRRAARRGRAPSPRPVAGGAPRSGRPSLPRSTRARRPGPRRVGVPSGGEAPPCPSRPRASSISTGSSSAHRPTRCMGARPRAEANPSEADGGGTTP
jgi:hypothetical protein